VATLRFLGPGDPDHLDAATAFHVRPGQVLRVLTRQLFAYPAAGHVADARQAFAPLPDMAAEMPAVSGDGLVHTIRVRPGVLWDSTPPREVTAHDFVRGLKRLADPAIAAGARPYFTDAIAGMRDYCDAHDAGQAAGLDVDGIAAPDDRTLVVRLTRPANDVLNLLALGVASAAPAEGELISNGPYRVAAGAARGEPIVLEPNPVWSRRRDPIRRRLAETITVGGNGNGRGDGAADLAWRFAVVSWGGPAPYERDHPHSYPAYALNPYLVLNMVSPNQGRAMRDVRVRRAIAHAVDKMAIAAIFDRLEGVSHFPQHSAIAPGNAGHRPFDPHPTPGDRGDPDRARQLLADAGRGDGLRLIAAVRDIGLHLEIMRSVARDLARCGIELDMRTCDQREYYGSLLSDPANARAGAWDIAEPGWTPDWYGNNGRALVQPLFQTDDRAGTMNFGCYSDAAVDRLIDRALAEPDPACADELWHRVDLRVMDDVAIVPILAFACRCCAARGAGAGWTTWSPHGNHWLAAPI
jgi:peptide/nickel transport system substrate-binding protein